MILGACTPALPPEPVPRALLRDVARAVESREQIGWFADELDAQAILPDALASACRTPKLERDAALRWLDEEIARQGGSAKEAYVRADKDLDAIRPIILWTRTRALLAKANAFADGGGCPFWVEEEADFGGIQTLARHFLVAAETGGRFYAQSDDGKFGFGGGGALRLLGGYGFNADFTLLFGLELGGAGRFDDIRVGKRASVPAILVIGAVPLVARMHTISDHFEAELAPLFYTNQLRGRTQLGGRFGVGYGFSRLLLRGFVPALTFSVNVDVIPKSKRDPAVFQIGAGARGSFATTLF